MDIDIGLSRIKRRINGSKRVLAFDLESLVKGSFLDNERIITISTYSLQGDQNIFMGNSKKEDEYELLKSFNDYLESYNPEILIGYNHVSYDITLINTKLVKLSYKDQLFPLKYYFGTSYLLDMMYVCALNYRLNYGDYKIRSLKKVVNSEEYQNLDLMRVKETLEIENMNPGQAVEYLWKNDVDKLNIYALGDVHDIIKIYEYLFC
jgi:hypothetical protein